MLIVQPVNIIPSEGMGARPLSIKVTSIAFEIIQISDSRTASLVFEEYPCNEINQRAQRIDSMLMTTINSTRVKAFLAVSIRI